MTSEASFSSQAFSSLESKPRLQPRSIPCEVWREQHLSRAIDPDVSARNLLLVEAFEQMYTSYYRGDQTVRISPRKMTDESYFDGIEITHSGFGMARIGRDRFPEKFQDADGRSIRLANRYYFDKKTGRAWRIDFVDRGEYEAGGWYYYTSIDIDDLMPEEHELDQRDYNLLELLKNNINNGYLRPDD